MTVKTRPPSPPGLPLVGHAFGFRRDPLQFIVDGRDQCGDVVLFNFAGLDVYQLNHPRFIQHVLVDNQANYTKGRFLRRASDLFGSGLLTSEGELWSRQRRLIQPSFNRSHIHRYIPAMEGAIEKLLAGWHNGQEIDLHQSMAQLTMAIAARSLFGADVWGEAEAVGRALDKVGERLAKFLGGQELVPLPTWLPVPRNRRYLQAIHELDEIVYQMIEKRRNRPEDDLLSQMLAAQGEDGTGMTDKQLRDEVMTLFLAGHETTALTLTYTFFLLDQNPVIRGRLHQELDQVLGGRPATAADLDALPYTDQVIKEALRLYPPAWSLGRQAVDDDEVGGYRIPAGSMVQLSQWVVHRDPRYFDEPLAFRPERWTPAFEQQLPRFAYFPFGGGPRLCVGRNFALVEATLALASIAGRWQLERVDDAPLELVPSITVRPQGSVTVRLTRREPGNGGPRGEDAGIDRTTVEPN